MTTADPNDMSVESVVAKETASSSAHKALTSPWASIVAVVIAVLWTVPEPSALMLLSLGAIGLLSRRARFGGR